MAVKRKTRLEPAELAWLCEQLALILRTGILLPEGIELLAESADSRHLRNVLEKLGAEMGKMHPLATAMQNTEAFPAYLVRMVHIGEVSGNLDQVLSGLATFYLRDSDLRKKVRSALIYPLVLLFLMLGIILLLIIRVLPVFEQILASFGGAMPGFARGLLRLGLFITSQAIWLLPLLVIIIAVFWAWLSLTNGGRRFKDRVVLRLPLVKKVFIRIFAARFALAMRYLLGSGLGFTASLSLSEEVMGNSVVSQKIKQGRLKIEAGGDVFTALQEIDIFPQLFIRMMALGSRAGELDQVMSKLADAYENEVNNRLTRLASLVEPFLVIILSLIVGAILLTVMLPLVEILSSIG